MRFFLASLALVLSACGDAGFSGGGSGKSIDAGNPQKNAGGGAGADAGDGGEDAEAGEGAGESESSSRAGKSGGDGSDGQEGQKDDTGNTLGEGVNNERNEEKVPVDELSSDPNGPSIGKCLANLNLSNIDKAAVGDVKLLETAGMSPFVNSTVTDQEQTEHERVVMVKMQGFGPVVNFDMNLLNPKGIYCIASGSFSVFTNRKVTICKTAKIASELASDMHLFNSANVLRVGCLGD